MYYIARLYINKRTLLLYTSFSSLKSINNPEEILTVSSCIILPQWSWRGRRPWGWWWRLPSSVPHPGTPRTSLCTSGYSGLWWGWWRSPSASPSGPEQLHIFFMEREGEEKNSMRQAYTLHIGMHFTIMYIHQLNGMGHMICFSNLFDHKWQTTLQSKQ